MDLKLEGKTALVLAASKGMGKATALALAREGATVAICARGKRELDATAEELEEMSPAKVLARALDVADAKARAKFLKDIGPVDILVTNGGGPASGGALSTTDKEWEEAVKTTMMAPIHWARAVAPGMMKRGYGRILMIESVSVKQPIDGLVLSNSMRAGVVGFAKTLARETASFGVTVNVLAPGYTKTERLEHHVEARAKAQKVSVESEWAKTVSAVPAGRVATPEELADLACFLASERAGYLTGGIYPVDGGLLRSLL